MYPEHLRLHAAMIEFGGWEMPLHYGSQIEEHHAVRKSAGMFDVSHMGILDIKGLEAKPFLRYLLANDIDKLKKPGKALYGCMLNEQGGILDDLITYFISREHYRLVVNAATTEKDFRWLKAKAQNFLVDIEWLQDYAMIAIQGRDALKKLSMAFPTFKRSIDTLLPFHFYESQAWFIARTGYTGEEGLEIMVPLNQAVKTWQALIEQGVPPCGLGARDTLRLEAGLNLYGQDMDEAVTPLESNLSWTLSFNDPDRHFMGRAPLEKQKIQGISSRLIALILENKGVLRHHQKVFLDIQGTQKKEDLKEVGWVTSGTFSPTLKKSIGFARIQMSSIPIETKTAFQYYVKIRDKLLKVNQLEPPFYRRKK